MEYELILQNVLTFLVVPIVIYLIARFEKFIKSKIKQIESDTAQKILNDALENVAQAAQTAVIETEQTFVKAVKREGNWSAETMEQAALQAYERTLQIASDAALKTVQDANKNIEAYIMSKIENVVNTDYFFRG